MPRVYTLSREWRYEISGTHCLPQRWGQRVHFFLSLSFFYSPFWTIASSTLSIFLVEHIFMGWGCQPHPQPPTWRTSVSLYVWVVAFDLSGMVRPASSYATTNIPLRIISPRKTHQSIIHPEDGGRKFLESVIWPKKMRLYVPPETLVQPLHTTRSCNPESQ